MEAIRDRVPTSLNDRLAFLMQSSVQNVGKKEEENEFAKAIKAYEDEMLTGLTDEEREKIKEELAKYAEKNNLKMPEDNDALLSYVKGLLKKYGFKGDAEDYAATFLIEGSGEGNEMMSTAQEEQTINKVMDDYRTMIAHGIRL